MKPRRTKKSTVSGKVFFVALLRILRWVIGLTMVMMTEVLAVPPGRSIAEQRISPNRLPSWREMAMLAIVVSIVAIVVPVRRRGKVALAMCTVGAYLVIKAFAPEIEEWRWGH